MVRELEGNFKVGQTGLYTKSWLPDETPKAKLVFVHGYSDHIGRYYGFFPYLAEQGIAVYGFDQRGWGRSVTKPAEKGLTGPTSEVIADIAAFTQSVMVAEPTTAPLFVMGHSMGGGEVLTLASMPEYEDSIIRHVRGWILEAPFIAFPESETPSTLKIFAGRLAGRFLPRFHLVNVIPAEYMSRDPDVVQSVKEDKLCHNTGTLEGLAGLLDRTLELVTGKVKLSPEVRSLWGGHGDADMGTSYAASKAWFDKQTTVADKTFKTYEGWYHQLHTEPNKEEFYRDVAEWILARCDSEASAAAVDGNQTQQLPQASDEVKTESKPESKL